ncbi:MAG: HNH endonuclease, partial [Candidatus Paceibacterota bacterium]
SWASVIMRKIKLTQGKFAIVDDEDYERINQFKWYYDKGRARRNIPASENDGKRTFYYMHWGIIGKPENDLEVDHINQNSIDNRKENLRFATHAENTRNAKLREDNTSGIRGVGFHEYSGLWYAQISIDGASKRIGYFKEKIDAIKAYNNAAIEYYGEFAQLNEIIQEK